MKTLFFKNIGKALAAAAVLILTLSSCSKFDDDEIVVQEGEAKLRMVNTVSGSNAQDLYQNSTKLNTSSISYGQVSNYLTLKAGVSTTVALKNENSETITASALAGLQVNSAYTAFYYSDLSGAGKITGLLDDNTAPAAGKVRVRFINLAPALSNTINITLASGTAIVTGIAYEYFSGYNTIDANTALNVTVLGGTTKVIPAAEFQSGKIYYVWFDAASSTSVNYHVVPQN